MRIVDDCRYLTRIRFFAMMVGRVRVKSVGKNDGERSTSH